MKDLASGKRLLIIAPVKVHKCENTSGFFYACKAPGLFNFEV